MCHTERDGLHFMSDIFFYFVLYLFEFLHKGETPTFAPKAIDQDP